MGKYEDENIVLLDCIDCWRRGDDNTLVVWDRLSGYVRAMYLGLCKRYLWMDRHMILTIIYRAFIRVLRYFDTDRGMVPTSYWTLCIKSECYSHLNRHNTRGKRSKSDVDIEYNSNHSPLYCQDDTDEYWEWLWIELAKAGCDDMYKVVIDMMKDGWALRTACKECKLPWYGLRKYIAIVVNSNYIVDTTKNRYYERRRYDSSRV